MAMQVRHARRLAAVKKMIMEEPRRFDMGNWARKSSEAPCGTAACIAGFLVWRGDGKAAIERYLNEYDAKPILDRACELLGLKIFYSSYAPLFHVESWPIALRAAYEGARREGDREAIVEVACRRIDLFLADHGFGPDGERLPTEPTRGFLAARHRPY